ncbi:MAG: ELWxxDGT repeat protein [Anaeromyxobacter sp.]
MPLRPPRLSALAPCLLAGLVACSGGGGDSPGGGANPAKSLAVITMRDGQSGYEPWALRDGVLSRIVDLAPGGGGSNPFALRPIGQGLAGFCANAPDGTTSPYVTDGTAGGTVRLTATGTAACEEIAVVGSRIFFAAVDVDHGQEPWVSDGTVAGTHLLADLAPGVASSFPQGFVPCGSVVCFAAYDVDHGYELWTTDGTAAGTHRIEIEAGSNGSSLFGLTPLNALVVFVANDADHGTDVHGSELWVTDGTAAGTKLLKDITPGAGGTDLGQLTAVGGRIFFSAASADLDYELWSTDGTPEGTKRVKNLNPTGPSYPFRLTPLGDEVFFSASDGINGEQLWVSDGTEAGTKTVAFINTDGSASIDYLAVHGGKLWFLADDGVHGRELWVSDGTEAGTHLVADSVPGAGGLSPVPLEALAEYGIAAIVKPSDELVFLGWEDDHGGELWRSDGTAAGTALIEDVNPGPQWSIPWD